MSGADAAASLPDTARTHFMYAIILRYKVPLSEVERHVEAHRAWLREHYAAGHFACATGTGCTAQAGHASRLDLERAPREF